MQHRPHPGRRNGLPAEEQLPQGLESLRVDGGDLVEERRGQEHAGDALLTDQLRQTFRREGDLLGHAHQAGSIQQRPPDFKGGGVEGGVGSLGYPVAGRQPDVVAVQHQAGDGALRDADALRRPRRAGGVHDISQAFAGDIVPRLKVLTRLAVDLA